jgi:hypothetical protein
MVRLRRPDQCDSRGDQPDDKESQREVGQGKLDEIFHGDVKFSVKYLTLARPLALGQVRRDILSQRFTIRWLLLRSTNSNKEPNGEPVPKFLKKRWPIFR